MRILLLVLGFISSGALAKTIISADYFTYAHYYDLGISYSADREGLNLELQTLGGATESEDFGSIKAGVTKVNSAAILWWLAVAVPAKGLHVL